MRRVLGVVIAMTVAGVAPCNAQVKAAGMPLRDGELPPGTVTVRVVRGGFSNNLPNQSVRLEVIGSKSETTATGADGRASFVHLPIGARVRASALVAGEALESEVFEVPAEAGVRVLLIAGEQSADAAVAAPVPEHGSGVPPKGLVAVAPVTDHRGQATPGNSTISVIRLTWVTLTLAMVVYVTRPWWVGRPAARTDSAALPE